MKTIAAARLAVGLAVSLGLASVTSAQPNEALEFYKKYLGVLAKAESLDVLLPFYTKELSSGLSKMPTEMQGNYLKMNRRTLSDLKVTKQEVSSTRARFDMTAKGPDGQPTSGSATLVKEGGAWKVEDEAWVANVPKAPGPG